MFVRGVFRRTSESSTAITQYKKKSLRLESFRRHSHSLFSVVGRASYSEAWCGFVVVADEHDDVASVKFLSQP